MNNYPPGMSHDDLVHVGEADDLNDNCSYFNQHDDHDWEQDETDKVCRSCGLMEDEDGNITEPIQDY